MQVTKISPINTRQIAFGPKNESKISFSGFSRDTFVWQDSKYSKFKQAQKKAQNTNWLRINLAPGNLLNKLEGLQYGLETFENIPIKEIYHIMKKSDTLELALVRGCRNGCKHCYVGARPPIKNDAKHTSKMQFEDFLRFTHDFGTMKDRLKMYHPVGRVAFFRDADCKDIYLTDRHGIEHPYQEINKIFYARTGLRSIFDTAGWDIKDIETQRRMDDFVDYYSQKGRMREIAQINISVNPFGNLMQESNALAAKGQTAESKEKRNAYVKNMANVFFTFTPLVKRRKFSVIGRSLPYTADKVGEKPYNSKAYNLLVKDILKELEEMYRKDLCGDQRVIKKSSQIKSNLEEIKTLCSSPDTNIGESARNNTFYSNVPTKQYTHKEVRDKFNTFIDTNGEVYLVSGSNVYKTTTHLDFREKNKKTAKILPEPKEIIDVKKFYK